MRLDELLAPVFTLALDHPGYSDGNVLTLSSAALSLAVNATFVAATLPSSCGQMQGGRPESGRMLAAELLCPGPRRSLRLDLHGSAVLVGGTGSDDEITALHPLLSLHNLADRADRVDDRCARRIRRECRQWLQDATTVRSIRERKHEGLLRLEPSGGSLEHLQ